MTERTLVGKLDGIKLVGAVSNGLELTGALLSFGVLSGILAVGGRVISGALATAYVASQLPYEGSYEVTPKVTGQELETKQKHMEDNITVHGIPLFDVSNQAGGSTVYIGTELEIK